MKKSGVWLEITTLAIPGLSDSDETFQQIAWFIKNELGQETPWHISKFSPEISWQLKKTPETPLKTLERAYKIGKESGLKYVYTGNVPGLDSENTFCPKCSTLAIKRIGYSIQRLDMKGKCPKCGENLNLILK
jgi:pyruvate formate lyase activating enzyme